MQEAKNKKVQSDHAKKIVIEKNSTKKEARKEMKQRLSWGGVRTKYSLIFLQSYATAVTYSDRLRCHIP